MLHSLMPPSDGRIHQLPGSLEHQGAVPDLGYPRCRHTDARTGLEHCPEARPDERTSGGGSAASLHGLSDSLRIASLSLLRRVALAAR